MSREIHAGGSLVGKDSIDASSTMSNSCSGLSLSGTGSCEASAGAAQKNRQLVTDEFAAATGQNRRTFDQARQVLLAAAGGESSDAAAVWKHAAKDRGVTIASGIGAP